MAGPIGNRNALRVGQTETSTANVNIKVTPTERDWWHAIAGHLGVKLNALIRNAVEEKYERLRAEGARPPRIK